VTVVIVAVVLALLVLVGALTMLGLRRREVEHPQVPGEPSAPPAGVATAAPVEVDVAPPDLTDEAVAAADAEVVEALDAGATIEEVVEVDVEIDIEAEPAVVEKPRLRDRLGRTRSALSGFLRGKGKIDDDTWDELEESLLLADVGVTTSQHLLESVRGRAKEFDVADADGVLDIMRDEVTAMLGPSTDRSLHTTAGEQNVWMFVGVNGVGKTTTIGKLAKQQVDGGKRVVLAAADTFRAAAADQLQMWAERTGGEIVRAQEGADPGSVVFDAMAAATSRNADLVLVDTAGRLHTKANLMEELKKLRRIVDRTEGALKEVLLVVDASTGQNGLVQAKQFAEAVDVTGIVLTKLDGTAKGGIVLAIQNELQLPVKVVGVGEGVEDLIPFDPDEFAAALFDSDS
jgi:fused signal recognition particle receptor